MTYKTSSGINLAVAGPDQTVTYDVRTRREDVLPELPDVPATAQDGGWQDGELSAALRALPPRMRPPWSCGASTT